METTETIRVVKPSGKVNTTKEVINVEHDPMQGHREGEYGIGASKAQHFIQHIRDTDLSKPGWRDEQEKWAEAAQLAVCEELTCPACQSNCKLLTGYHWDTNRLLQGKDPVNKDYLAVHKMVCSQVSKH